MSRFRTMIVNRSDFDIMPDLEPPADEVFDYLLGQAINGQVGVYFAAIPLKLIEPFSKDYDPRKHPVGQQAIDAFFQAWQQNEFKPGFPIFKWRI